MANLRLVSSPARLDVFTRLAALLELTPSTAVLLPAVVEVAARKVGLLESVFVAELFRNSKLRDYVAERIGFLAENDETCREAIRDFQAQA